MHNYVVKNWNWIPVLLTLGQVVDGGSADNLKHIMPYTLMLHGGLSKQVGERLVCMGADAVSVFQGARKWCSIAACPLHAWGSLYGTFNNLVVSNLKYLVCSDGVTDFSCGSGRRLAMMCNISMCIIMMFWTITSIFNGCNLCNCDFKVQCVVYCCALICFHNLIKLHECDAYVVEQFCWIENELLCITSNSTKKSMFVRFQFI